MIYLLLSILSSTLIFITFKITERFNANLVKLIVINYVVASLLGFLFYPGTIEIKTILTSNWLPFSMIIGILFILMFFLIGKSTRIAGVAVTTIAGKMSMAIPILFSILYFSEPITFLKITGLILAFIALFLSIFKPGKNQIRNILFLFPLIIFLGTGLADSFVKYSQHFYVKNDEALLFSSVVFSVALFLGLAYSFIIDKKPKEYLKPSVLWGGIILGTSNFGSLYFFIQALHFSKMDSSVVFGVNNLSIVCLSVIIGYFVFSEKMNKINLLGILLAIASIIILSRF